MLVTHRYGLSFWSLWFTVTIYGLRDLLEIIVITWLPSQFITTFGKHINYQTWRQGSLVLRGRYFSYYIGFPWNQKMKALYSMKTFSLFCLKSIKEASSSTRQFLWSSDVTMTCCQQETVFASFFKFAQGFLHWLLQLITMRTCPSVCRRWWFNEWWHA